MFARRPDPDDEPFVSEGQEVEVGVVVGPVEVIRAAMRSGPTCVIDRSLVQPEELVETDQDVASLRDG